MFVLLFCDIAWSSLCNHACVHVPYLGHFMGSTGTNVVGVHLSWQVDAVMSVWFEVLQLWYYLEPIFVGSLDIRKQLPEECKQFDAVDESLRELMKDARQNPIVSGNCALVVDG